MANSLIRHLRTLPAVLTFWEDPDILRIVRSAFREWDVVIKFIVSPVEPLAFICRIGVIGEKKFSPCQVLTFDRNVARPFFGSSTFRLRGLLWNCPVGQEHVQGQNTHKHQGSYSDSGFHWSRFLCCKKQKHNRHKNEGSEADFNEFHRAGFSSRWADLAANYQL